MIDAVAAAKGDLGLVAVDAGPAAGAWWKDLEAASAPKIIARLPFVERPDHPAGRPLFVIAKPLSEAAARDVVLYALAIENSGDSLTTLSAALTAIGCDIGGSAREGEALSLLVAAPGSVTPAALREASRKAGKEALSLTEIGSHAARFDLAKSEPPEAKPKAMPGAIR